jgi:Fe-S-cluster-containing dehydrogenase component
MDIGRRDFIKILSAGAVTAASPLPVLGKNRYEVPPKAMGILYDATLCIGCRACEVGCKIANDMPVEESELNRLKGVGPIWDAGPDLSQQTLNKIKLYKNGTAAEKDREVDGFSFIKRACMHCLDPDCVSACPVTALHKDPVSGIVKWDIDACIGCRYCQVACPFDVPKFEYDKAIPEIVKCQMCDHLQAKGEIPACCSYCPTGASLFGPYEEILAEAHRRLKLKPGEVHDYPVSDIRTGETQSHPVKKYVEYIYGEKDGGGTQYIMLSAVPFEKLGMPKLPQHSGASESEGIQHTLYKGMIAPGALLIGLLYAAHRNMKNEEPEE